jgi:phosphatidate phosphatase APP1
MIRLVISVILTSLILGGCNGRITPNSNSRNESTSRTIQNAPKRLTLSSEKEVTFYPAYGYSREDNWVIDLRGWVHQSRKSLNRFVTVLATLGNKCNGQSMDIFKSRSDVFESDDEFAESVVIEFDSDPDRKQYPSNASSNQNGIVELTLTLPKQRAERLLEAQNSPNKWLTYRAVSSGHVGLGRIRLIESQGISIVSDIDDTIKISEIPAGQHRVFDYTFCREFEAAPGMADRYRDWNNSVGHPDWSDVTFHYVSGGPQQLFGPLYDFLIAGKGGFPEGTFHLRFFPKNLLDRETRENLKRFAAGPMDTTFDHKVTEITKLMETFPGRKFILVGDSGEVDPEVYRRIRDEHPQQVEEIWIRDLVDDLHDNPYRLARMSIIAVDKIVCMEEPHYKALSDMVDKRDQPNKYQKKAVKNCD